MTELGKAAISVMKGVGRVDISLDIRSHETKAATNITARMSRCSAVSYVYIEGRF